MSFPFKPEFNQSQPVREDGRIVLPFVGPMEAAGKTPDMLRTDLENLYAQHRYDPRANRLSGAKVQYLIGVGDVLEIRFDSHAEYNERATVRPDGKISLARVKTVIAEGKAPEELEKELTERYAAFVKDSSLVVMVRTAVSDMVYVDGKPARVGLRNFDHLTVAVTHHSAAQVVVGGEVGRVGAYPYRASMTVSQAIALAGGSRRSARLDSVVILRHVAGDTPVALKVSVRHDLWSRAEPEVPLQPFDIVIVPGATAGKVQDVLDPYLSSLATITHSESRFSFVTSLNPGQAILPAAQTGGTGVR